MGLKIINFRHCEEGELPDEAISLTKKGIASPYRARNDEVAESYILRTL